MRSVNPVVRSVTVRVPAKVNLQLSVGPIRGDGYHEVASVFHAVDIYDEVTAADGVPGSGILSPWKGWVRAPVGLTREPGVASGDGTRRVRGCRP